MEGDKADVTSLLNHLETQLQLQDTLIFKLQQEQSARQSWPVRHGSFNDPKNNHHPMHASLNASLNENFQRHGSKNDFKERGKVKLSQQDMLKNDSSYKEKDLSHSEKNQLCQHNSHDPMCYLQKLINSQHFARCNYSQQLQKYSLAYYKGMRRKEGVVKECKREMDQNDILIFDTLHQRNYIRDELIILQKKNQKLKSQIDVLKNASEKELRTKKIISKLLNRRSDIESKLKKHCQAISAKESKLTEGREKSDLLTKDLSKKRKETQHAVDLLEGMFMREMAEQSDEMKDKKESLKCLETTNLKLIQQLNTKHHSPQSSPHQIASVDSTNTPSSLISHYSQALFSIPPTTYTSFDSTNTIKPALNYLNHHHYPSKNTTKSTQFHHQFPIITTTTTLNSYSSVSIAVNTLAADTLATNISTNDTLVTDTLATNSLAQDSTDIQCVIEKMQDTLIMLEKGFSDEGDNKNYNKSGTNDDIIFGSIQSDESSQIFSPSVFASVSLPPYKSVIPSFINTMPNQTITIPPRTTPSPHSTTPHTTIPHATTSNFITPNSTTPNFTTSHSTTPNFTTSQSTTPHFPSIFKTSVKPLSINSQHKSNERSFFNAPFIPPTISPNKPHPFSSKPTRLITISSPLKPPTHLLPPTKSSS